MDFGVGRVTVGLSGEGLLSHYGRGCVDTPPTADRFVEADHFGLDLGRPLGAQVSLSRTAAWAVDGPADTAQTGMPEGRAGAVLTKGPC
jgi:hypothetical protein